MSRPQLVMDDAIEEANRLLDGVVVRTPLVRAFGLAVDDGPALFLKCENLQRSGAFKFRGAYNALARLPAESRARGVITYSSGNHAQAIALAARILRIPATVVMPTTAPPVKVAGARRHGAEVLFHGTTSEDRMERALALAAEHGFAVVPPFDHPDVIAGQGTVGLELLAACPDAEAVLVPVGGGGLLSGVAAWIKRRKPGCLVVGVEPRGAAAMALSITEGRPVTIARADTIADGLAPLRPGDLTFAHARELVDQVVTVTDDAIRESAHALLRDHKLLVEYSGAAAVAAIRSGAWAPRGRPAVAVISGGNIDPAIAAVDPSAQHGES